mmetsp:Transcript_25763/g.38199  ORF Transcript_25763/g.38199 Transcript_25763/m.38199 type:complete len:280 (-) Transcript_25763:112-951(-)
MYSPRLSIGMFLMLTPLAASFSLDAKLNLASRTVLPAPSPASIQNSKLNASTDTIDNDIDIDIDIDNNPAILSSRKSFIQSIATAAIATTTTAIAFTTLPSSALASASPEDDKTFTRRIKNDSKPTQSFAYTLTLPNPPSPTNKPLQTHLDEVNLPMNSNPYGIQRYTYGVTVDPIRLTSLRQFGTPNEVAAKIVMAELRRDGVLDVTMGRDPLEDMNTGAYDVEYVSDGSRGRKHYVTRTIVEGEKLYVLTVVCKQDDWNLVEEEVWKSVSTFRVLDP